MNPTEIRKTIALMGIILLIGISAQNIFVLLTPLPDDPDMARAQAGVYIKEAEARLEFQWLKTTLYAGIISLLSGSALVFVSLWAAMRFFAPHKPYRHQLTGHEQ